MMRIEVEVETNKCGDEWLDQHTETIGISKGKDYKGQRNILLEIKNERYILPIEIFGGMLSEGR